MPLFRAGKRNALGEIARAAAAKGNQAVGPQQRCALAALHCRGDRRVHRCSAVNAIRVEREQVAQRTYFG